MAAGGLAGGGASEHEGTPVTTSLPEPSFVDRDPVALEAEIVAQAEQYLGRPLQPAQQERIWIKFMVYRELLARIAMNEAGKLNLVRYSRFPMLDLLGERVDCERLQDLAAGTQLRYTLTAVQPTNVVIPLGNRVKSKDQVVVFATTEALTIVAGQTEGAVAAKAQTTGIVGNGYLAGEVNLMLDPIASVASAANTTTTDGGYDREDEDPYRARIMVAPEQFTVAGPRGMYRSLALKAHPSIVDVFVERGDEGAVNIYPLVTTGVPSSEILDAVAAVLDPEEVIPLTDTVSVLAPTPVDYAVSVELTLYTTADQAYVEAEVAKQVDVQVKRLKLALGRDRVPAQFTGAIMSVPGIYNLSLIAPSFLATAPNEYPNCTGVTITTVGVTNG